MTLDPSSAVPPSATATPFSGFWLVCWSGALALGWLLPNHYAPWLAFHFDAWIAGALAVAAVVVAVRCDQRVPLHRMALFCALAVCIPFLQFWFGLLPFSGQAWLGSAYLFGLMVAMVAGAYWESADPCQPVDGLFLAIGIASIVSVGLALYQWLGLSIGALDLWVMGTPGPRSFANFVQPNQLATFLLWGVLATAWGVARGRIGPPVGVFMAAYLLLGVALTQSRSALFAIAGLVVAVMLWHRLWHGRTVLWSVLGLAALYALWVVGLPLVGSALYLDSTVGIASRFDGDNNVRLSAYPLLLDAALRAPWVGYGWSQTAVAQLSVAADHATLGGILMHAHNLFLDLVLWCGFAIGLLLCGALAWWFVGKLRRVDSVQNAILMLFVGVVGWHAMLELPLHYAYMLLPVGLVMGVLNQRLAEPVVVHVRRPVYAGVVLMAIALLAVLTRDYLRIEENFFVLRFERARIGTKPAEPVASVLLLDHMNEFVRLGRTPARKGMTPQELQWMHDAAYAYPALGNLFTLALALAWNQRTEDAQALVIRLQRITKPPEYADMRGIWQSGARSDAALAAVSWPD